MKFLRGFFTCILIILASHGAYQIYKQYFKAPFQVSDDVRKELQSAGIHLDEMDDENGVTNLFSDSGNFGMYSENAPSSSVPPSFLSSSPDTALPEPISHFQPPSGLASPNPSLHPPFPMTSEPMIPYASGFASTSQVPHPQATPQSNVPETLVSPLPVLPDPNLPILPSGTGNSHMPVNNLPEVLPVPLSTPPEDSISSPISSFPEEPGVAVTTPGQTSSVVPSADLTPMAVVPPQIDMPEMPLDISETPVFNHSHTAAINGGKPDNEPEMSTIVPAPIMIDNIPEIPEVTEQSGIEPSKIAETADSALLSDGTLLPDGFAMSGKPQLQTPHPRTEEILPVNSISSGRPFDAVTPLPVVLDENDKNNIAENIRQDIVQQCQSILQSFDSQDTEKIKNGYIQLSRLYFNKNLTPEEHRYVAVPLNQVAGGLFFSNQTHIIEPPYLVKEGETMTTIATDMQVTPELLWKINGFAPQTNLQPGMQIKVIRGPLEARIKPNTCELIITSQGNFVCRFKIGVGMNYAGQKGTFAVQDKVVNPAYDLGFGLDRIEAGDPGNPLGCRWIKLSQTVNNIGIHGTNRPDLIGVNDRSMVPPGVFFMKNEDVIEVCDMLVPGSSVVIER